jgi:RNA polymerase sigma-70 factor (ECF subfamily)
VEPTVDLGACLRGDARAWAAFVDRYARVIYAAVRRALRPAGPAALAQADDVAQDVFVRLVADDFRLLRTFDPSRASLATWLTVIARRTALDHLRRRAPAAVRLGDAQTGPSAGRATSAGAGSGRAEALGAGTTPDPAAAAERADEVAAIPTEVLTPRQRLVLVMCFEREMSVEAVARVLGIAPQTVRSTRHKALERLRQTLGQPP